MKTNALAPDCVTRHPTRWKKELTANSSNFLRNSCTR